jgi:hypothetical protein
MNQHQLATVEGRRVHFKARHRPPASELKTDIFDADCFPETQASARLEGERNNPLDELPRKLVINFTEIGMFK